MGLLNSWYNEGPEEVASVLDIGWRFLQLLLEEKNVVDKKMAVLRKDERDEMIQRS